MTRRNQKKKSPIRLKITHLMRTKLVVLFVAIVLAFVFLVGRVTYINAKNGEKYTKIVLDQQQYNSRVIPLNEETFLIETALS